MISALLCVFCLVSGLALGFMLGYRRGVKSRLADIAESTMNRAAASARAVFGGAAKELKERQHTAR